MGTRGVLLLVRHSSSGAVTRVALARGHALLLYACRLCGGGALVVPPRVLCMRAAHRGCYVRCLACADGWRGLMRHYSPRSARAARVRALCPCSPRAVVSMQRSKTTHHFTQ